MNNEETKPSKDMMDMIKEHTDKTCDMVIDNCIKAVENTPSFSATSESYKKLVIKKLSNLKNKSNG